MSFSATQATNGSAGGSPLMGLRILLLEDHEETRRALAYLLQRQGLTVLAASRVSEAIAVCERSQPQFIVSDMGLPHGDGCTFIHHVRTVLQRSSDELPAVAVSALMGEEKKQRAIAAGFQAALDKRDFDGLVAALEWLH